MLHPQFIPTAMHPTIIALVPAAGTGARLGDDKPKQYLDLNGRPMIYHTLKALAGVDRVARIIVILSPKDQYWRGFSADWQDFGGRVETRAIGGETRAASVANGLAALDCDADDWVLVHDAARPGIETVLVNNLIDQLSDDKIGGLLATPLADTIKRADSAQRVATTLPREDIWCAQTPQMFRYGLLREAIATFPTATDEAGAIEALGHHPKLVMGSARNFKITYAGDMQLARLLLAKE